MIPNASSGENAGMPPTSPAQHLRNLVAEVERLEVEKKEIADAIKGVFTRAKLMGFDRTAMKRVIADRKIDAATRQERDSLEELYRAALGMLGTTPLGAAAVNRFLHQPPPPPPGHWRRSGRCARCDRTRRSRFAGSTIPGRAGAAAGAAGTTGGQGTDAGGSGGAGRTGGRDGPAHHRQPVHRRRPAPRRLGHGLVPGGRQRRHGDPGRLAPPRQGQAAGGAAR